MENVSDRGLELKRMLIKAKKKVVGSAQRHVRMCEELVQETRDIWVWDFTYYRGGWGNIQVWT